jgi:ketosteroid isomerase-like protein
MSGSQNNEDEVRATLETWIGSIRRKDIDGILRNHSPDIVMFDVPPPFRTDGLNAYRKTWQTFFSWSADPITFRVKDMKIVAGTDVALAIMTMRCRGPGKGGQIEDLDFRLTVGLRKDGDQWFIVHEHHSVPADD